MDVRFLKVTKRFGERVVVDDLTLEVEDGEFVVLLGPSGCGKTTSLRMLAGLEDVTSGDILIGGERVNDLAPQERDVAMVFQSYALYPHMTIAENIAYPLRVRRVAREERKARVERVARMLEIESLLGARPRELSGGERQRVALARAIVREPRAYLMDEPLSNLDAKLRVQMRGELKRLQHELRTTTVYVTHDQSEAMTLATRVAVMRHGRLQQFASPLTIYNHPANRFVAEFVGNPPMNFIEGRTDAGARAFIAGGNLSLPLSDSQLERMRGHERVTLGIRPEHIHVSGAERDGWLHAVVHVTEEMGHETFVFLRLDDGKKIIARAGPDFSAAIDTPVSIRFEMDKADFFETETGEALRRS